ncbi:ribbon-helix-helix domain-containing protein [Rhizobium sp. LEGMi198b]|uniref:ribbon-helix-helix domain-containing protein n=1 Tax=unclassified Rhizobium TaxID=2613769 RepID=UPI000CDF530D|nr:MULTISPECIES: ribbon-helix-helix domain-containing protein [Rhizobium]AVA20794.1 ribbon-helix-helix domain-containing protein [Rhizobium sp. NXC24]MDK4738938.1 ribbon-helix-helix domain-containing protein [Rhizobium sp. CNPSo 3464]UWU22006.1 ribbon-helix-helix domain-containing protein [Rhizobium tropici]WFU02821.1 ribbon-helix-helix domain-containing protein [Rhizobium sp. CB3171]
MNEKLSISLPSEMVAAIKSRVDAGVYASTSEVLRAAVRVWLREEEEYQQRIAAIRHRVEASLDDPRSNLSGHEVKQRLDAFFDKRR